VQTGARCPESRRQARQHTGDGGEPRRKRQEAAVEPRLGEHEGERRQQDRRERLERPEGQCKAGHAANERDQDALGQELLHEPRPARPEREARGHFVGPRGSAGEKEICDIGAGDQQDETERRDHDQGRGAAGASGPPPDRGQRAVHGRPHRRGDPGRLDRDPRRAARLPQVDPGRDDVELCFDLRQVASGSAAANQGQPPEGLAREPFPVRPQHGLDRDRRKIVQTLQIGLIGARGRHPDDGDLRAIQPHGASHDPGVAGKRSGPQAVPEHDDRGRPGAAVVCHETPSNRRWLPEDVEEVAGHVSTGNLPCWLPPQPYGPLHGIAQQSGQRLRAIAKGDVLGGREPSIDRTLLVAAGEAFDGLAHVDELVGRRHRERAEQHAVEQGERPHVEPDAKGNRQDGRCREARAGLHPSHGIRQVEGAGLEARADALTSHLLLHPREPPHLGQGQAPGGLLVQTRPAPACRELVGVRTELLGQRRVDLAAPDEVPPEAAESGDQRHPAQASMSRTAVTAVTIRAHCAVSALSLRLPAVVSA